MKYKFISRPNNCNYHGLEIGKVYVSVNGLFDGMYTAPDNKEFNPEWAVWQPVNFIDYYEAIRK